MTQRHSNLWCNILCLNLKEECTDVIMAMICDLGSKLLICFDGLDEYQIWKKFANEVMKSSETAASDNSILGTRHNFNFKVAITSRFSSFKANEELHSIVELRINLLDFEKVPSFVKNHTQASVSKETVSYFNSGENVNLNAPRIIYHSCYQTEVNGELLNISLLYLSFVRRMPVKEIDKGRLGEVIDLARWKWSDVIKSTANLAFSESVNGISKCLSLTNSVCLLQAFCVAFWYITATFQIA